MTQPFKVESADVSRLNDLQLTQLLNELLHAEAQKNGIAAASVQVALNIRVGDGGEDGRINWEGCVPSTDYLPNRLTMFQNKATEMGAAAYANEIMTAARASSPSRLKPKVEEVLDSGGAYIVFTTQELNTQQIDERLTSVREKLREQGKAYADTCSLHIYDASRIAGWVNLYVPTIVAVLNWVGKPIERGVKTYSLWSEHEHMSVLPFAEVASRESIISSIQSGIHEEKSCYRIIGLSGLGKTRTAHHLLGCSEYLKSLVVYIDANHLSNIDALVADWVNLSLKAIIVVDNCSNRLHDSLVQEVRRVNSRLSLLSLDYNLDSVSPPTLVSTLKKLEDVELLELLSPFYQERLPDLDRVVNFAQGFPQMAVLLAEARLHNDPAAGALSDDQLANKLLWGGDRAENPTHLKILQVCSLFNHFGVEGEAEPQLQYISDLLNVDIDTVFECIQDFTGRGLIDRRGRLGQVVPKPLAIRLASQWWSNARGARRLELVEDIPEDMVEGFCKQVEMLDFHPDVKELTFDLCGIKGLFGQAEVILSNWGSRLFRSFVVVAPEVTSNSLYQIIESLSDEAICDIEADARRNLVWALEMLCFHDSCFEQAAWCMFKLAMHETESWSNNATGLFAQLYRVRGSGTEAKPEKRFALLGRALALSAERADLVVIEALSEAVSTHGGSRTIGAENQGSKTPLEEWRPAIWQEIFDFWDKSFQLLLELYQRGSGQKEKVRSHIGHSIRGFVANGRLDMLDGAIKFIVGKDGPYWPEALNSINNTFEYDSKGLPEAAEEKLNEWLELLSPDKANLDERLKITVIDPPWTMTKSGDGKFVDVAEQNAKKFAAEASGDWQSLVPYLPLLLTGEQRQTHHFAAHLGLGIDVKDCVELIRITLDIIIKINEPNPTLIIGLYRGLYQSDKGQWQHFLDLLLEKEEWVHLYCEAVRTGEITTVHLDKMLKLVEDSLIPENDLMVLSYGRVTEKLLPEEISRFCEAFAAIREACKWPALDILYMYCFGQKEMYKAVSGSLEKLLIEVSISTGGRNRATDLHKWKELATRFVGNDNPELAKSLVLQMITACDKGLDHSDLWNYIKPLLLELMQSFGELLWPRFGDAIVSAKGLKLYWLQQLLDRENSFSNKMPSVLSVLDVDTVIEWCRRDVEKGPAFVATCVNVFEEAGEQRKPSELFVAVLEAFGGQDRVKSGLRSNLANRGWSGSLVPYLEDDKACLLPLMGHSSSHVRSWVGEYISYIDRQIEFESKRDDEQDFGVY